MGQHPFDMVLLDLRMPGMDGMTVLKAIKKNWPESAVIIITSYPSVETAKEAVTPGAYDYLAKSISPDGVINAAGAMLHKQSALRYSPCEYGICHLAFLCRNCHAGSGWGTSVNQKVSSNMTHKEYFCKKPQNLSQTWDNHHQES